MLNRVSHAGHSCQLGSAHHLQKLCDRKLLPEAICYAVSSLKHGLTLPHTAILSLLQHCTRARDPSTCREAHSFILSTKFLHDTQIMEELVLMLSSCGCLQEAQQVFNEIPRPSSSTWTAIISACSSSGQCKHALQCLYTMRHLGIEGNRKTAFANTLKACSSARSLFSGRLLHEEIVRTGLDLDTKFGNMILNMYMTCDSVEDACRVFDRLIYPDVVSWGTMMLGFASHGHGLCALVLFENMQKKGLVPNSVVLLGLLKACLHLGGLVKALQAHDQVVRYGLESDVRLASVLIDMFNKLGNMKEGLLLFGKLKDANAVTWGSLIAGFVQHGDGVSALQLFEQMKQVGASLDKFVYSCVLQACILVDSVGQGKHIHIQLMCCNLKLDIVVGNCLISMYAKCGELDAAIKVFDNMQNRDVVSWGALIAGYVDHDNGQVALELHNRMQQEGLKPDLFTSSCLLKACGTMGALQNGRSIHEYVLRKGYSANTIIGNALIDMYARCGSLEDAQSIFIALHSPDLMAWDAMIAGLVQHGKSANALEMYPKMQEKGVHPDQITFLSMLKACGNVQDVEEGRVFNDQIVLKGFDSDVIVGNALIDMYIKCKSLSDARSLFDKLPKRAVVSWGVMISGYAQHEHIGSAIELLNKMHSENVCPDSTTFLCILKACSKLRALSPGRQIHLQVLICGYDVELAINNTLVDMYAKCGSLQEAHKVFDTLSDRSVVTWNILISGYVHNGDGLSALELWSRMYEEDVMPIKVTFLCTLKACSIIGAIEQGRKLHQCIVGSGLDAELVIGNTIIDMYANCGSLEDANQLFESMDSPDLVSWTAIIAGRAYCGSYSSARQTLQNLQAQGLKPNEDIFLSLLSACRQAGLSEEGHWCFQSMIKEHGFTPSIEHCSSMVDLLGHTGYLREATSFIRSMPCEPDVVLWTSLLASSNLFGNVELGNVCVKELVELSYHDSSVYEPISKHADLQEEFMTLDELQVVLGVQEVLVSVDRGSMVQDSVVRSNSYYEDDTALLKTKRLREDTDVSCVGIVRQSTLSRMEQDIAFGGSCSRRAGSIQQHPAHCMEVCIF